MDEMKASAKPNVLEFERLVRAYLSEEVSWQTVHEYAIEMEWASVAEFPAAMAPLGELHLAFLADERDDPQFRLDRPEISKLLSELNQERTRHNKQ